MMQEAKSCRRKKLRKTKKHHERLEAIASRYFQMFEPRTEGTPTVNNAVIDVIQSRGILANPWPVAWNLTYKVYPEFVELQRDLSKAIGAKDVPPEVSAHIEDLMMTQCHRLVATAYALGTGVGRCYSRAVDPMIRPRVKGSIR